METQINLFKDVFSEPAARMQAEEKRSTAFGTLASLKVWDRPKEADIALVGSEKRYEPFWYVRATRRVLYNKKALYVLKAVDGHAQQVTVLGQTLPITASRPLELSGVEHCEAVTTLSEYYDGLKRKEGDLRFVELVGKHLYDPVTDAGASEFVEPELTLGTLLQQVKHTLMKPIEAGEMLEDSLEVTQVALFYRPVYAFEYAWRDKKATVEVDGLTGKIKRDGSMFGGMLKKMANRDVLFDVGAELAGAVVPGGGVVVKMVGQLSRKDA